MSRKLCEPTHYKFEICYFLLCDARTVVNWCVSHIESERDDTVNHSLVELFFVNFDNFHAIVNTTLCL